LESRTHGFMIARLLLAVYSLRLGIISNTRGRGRCSKCEAGMAIARHAKSDSSCLPAGRRLRGGSSARTRTKEERAPTRSGLAKIARRVSAQNDGFVVGAADRRWLWFREVRRLGFCSGGLPASIFLARGEIWRPKGLRHMIQNQMRLCSRRALI
jgi:hypothetical protein